MRNHERENPKSTSRAITEAFNDAFAGAMLPGETQPRPKRSLAAIACTRIRNSQESEKSGKKRTADDAGLEGEEDHKEHTGETKDGQAKKEDGNSKDDQKDEMCTC
jgi:hypothetical protein